MASKPERILPDNTDELLYVKLTKKDVTKYCGYRKEYLSQNLTEMEQELIVCKECTGIMREPSLCNGNTTCLVCSERPSRPNTVKMVHNSVAKLNIKCPLLRDCNWNGNLSEADQHLNTCVHFLIECAKCQQTLPRGETDTHKANLCAMREIKCDFCGKYGIARELDNHLTFCLEYLISCPNNCGKRFPRKDSSKHESECQLQLIECPFAKYGCRAKSMLRRYLLAHKKDNLVEHTDFSLDRIDKLENENIRLKDTQKKMEWELKLTKRLDGVEWEIKNVNKLETGQTIEGPTFYVNKYKLKVCATLRLSFLGVRMNFFLKRVEGEFDRKLTEASVTNYRMIIIDKQDHKESTYLDGSMNYQLKIGSKSTCFKEINGFIIDKHLTAQDDTLLVRFYFDIYTQLPLTSVETQQQYSLSHEIRHEPVDPFKERFK